MSRTTDADVAAIVEVDSAISLTPFIEVAHSLVDEIAVQSDSPEEARLILVETWLAAHFYCQRDVRPSAEKAGPVSVSYESIVDLGLNNTRFGQTAMILDTSGYLKSLGRAKRRVSVSWLGKTEEEQEM